MRILFSHPTGNQNVRAALAGLQQQDILGHFSTTVAVFGDGESSSSKILSEVYRRSYDKTLKGITSVRPFREVGRLLCSKFKFRTFTAHEEGFFSIDAVIKDLDKSVSQKLSYYKQRGITSIYAYEDGAMETFSAAKKEGIDCFYDLPIGYWRAARKLLEIEKETWPEWVSTMSGFNDSESKLLAKDKEIELADKIFVASSFTALTLSEYPGILPPVKLVPYGFPSVFSGKKFDILQNKKLKMLFVGGLSQRKGLANLFAAVNKLINHVELTVVGQGNTSLCEALQKELVKHNWIPSLPHGEILSLMRAHDVFIFPSLFEGFGLVITEAMSQGLPVITTDRTVGPDFIRNDENGWIIKASSTEAIIEVVEKILANKKKLITIGKSAMETAILRPWVKYGEDLAIAITDKS